MKELPIQFDSADEELRFLRGLVAVQRLADEVLEDCLDRRLGLAAAADAFLGQCARMIHARAAFVQVCGTQAPVLTRVWGTEYADVSTWVIAQAPLALPGDRTVFTAPLTLGRTSLGTIGFLLPGHFEQGGQQVMQLVTAIAEVFDSAVLCFLALDAGASPLERLDELSRSGELAPQGRLGRYELLLPLGTGGMAQVMVARALGPGGVSRLVALKRILPRLAEDEAMVTQFFDEAKVCM